MIQGKLTTIMKTPNYGAVRISPRDAGRYGRGPLRFGKVIGRHAIPTHGRGTIDHAIGIEIQVGIHPLHVRRCDGHLGDLIQLCLLIRIGIRPDIGVPRWIKLLVGHNREGWIGTEHGIGMVPEPEMQRTESVAFPYPLHRAEATGLRQGILPPIAPGEDAERGEEAAVTGIDGVGRLLCVKDRFWIPGTLLQVDRPDRIIEERLTGIFGIDPRKGRVGTSAEELVQQFAGIYIPDAGPFHREIGLRYPEFPLAVNGDSARIAHAVGVIGAHHGPTALASDASLEPSGCGENADVLQGAAVGDVNHAIGIQGDA